MVVGEGFINHQEHDAGEEGQGQDDQNRHLEGGQTLVSVCKSNKGGLWVCGLYTVCETGLG